MFSSSKSRTTGLYKQMQARTWWFYTQEETRLGSSEIPQSFSPTSCLWFHRLKSPMTCAKERTSAWSAQADHHHFSRRFNWSCCHVFLMNCIDINGKFHGKTRHSWKCPGQTMVSWTVKSHVWWFNPHSWTTVLDGWETLSSSLAPI